MQEHLREYVSLLVVCINKISNKNLINQEALQVFSEALWFFDYYCHSKLQKNSNLIVRGIKKDLEINFTFMYTFSLYNRMIVLHSVPTLCPLQGQLVFFVWA